MSDLMTAPERGTEAREAPRLRRGRLALVTAVAAAVVFSGLAAVLATRLGDGPRDYQGTALLGDPVPDLVLPVLDGGEVDLRGFDDQAVIINFFNSWCVPCHQEEPSLRSFHARHQGEADFAMLGVVRDDTERAIRRYVRKQGTPWTVVLDPGARAAVEFATAGQPETFAVSPSGHVVAVHRGPATVADLEAMLAIARGEREATR